MVGLQTLDLPMVVRIHLSQQFDSLRSLTAG